MGSVGDAYDNALAESFFASLETELIYRSSWRTQADARPAVFDYIEAFLQPDPAPLGPRLSVAGRFREEVPFRHDHRRLIADRPRKRGNFNPMSH